MQNENGPPTLDSWCLIELLGRQQIVGKVTEATIAGGAFIRCDVPSFNGKPAYTRFFGPSAIYSINPVTEETARALLTQSRFRNEPVQSFQVPMLTSGTEDGGPISANVDYCPDCQELMEHCTCNP